MKTPDKATILIVDDKSANIFALENLLAEKDRIFVNATNGRDALKIVLHKDIDLVILDVQMPDLDGFEVAQILKSNRKTKDIPILFASAEKKEYKSMMKGYEEGAIDYLLKPLDPELAKAKVAIFLKTQLQKKELIEKNSSLQKSELLINNSTDIIGIIDAATFKIEEINSAFTDILGYSREETVATTLVFFLSAEDKTLIGELTKQKKERLSFETRIYCKDRSIKWLHWKIVVKDEKWLVNARDITEVKEVEKIRNYLATVVKQSNDAIYIHNNEGKIISWNEGAEKIYGYTEEEALKMKLWNMIPEHMQSEIEEMVNNILEGKKIEWLETRRITKHGKIVDVLLSASVLTDPGNDQKSIVITERDITLQKKAEEKILQLNTDLKINITQLETTNKELESFSYSVSHDLRAPLRALNAYSKIIEEDHYELLNDDVKALLDNVQSNAQRMGRLIDDLLAFSKLGRKEVEKSLINMNNVTEYVVHEIGKSTTHRAAIKINSLHPAEADYALLHQVWMNLISNAIKYSGKKDKPEIEIGSTELENEITYYIKDNGAGFNMQYADKLFAVFQRLHNTDEFEGTGIGLAIVQRIIIKHGGKIWAEGEVDKGATFYFTLPKFNTT